jgi:Fe-S cluster biosynthesis and repair protein YggX
MSHIVYCLKLKRDAEGLAQPPMPGEIGQKIYDSISKEAWQLWLQHQTMLINEYRLSLIDPKSRVFLLDEMQKFLFGEGSEKPAGYIPKNSSSA